jgi:hypothetical protein
MDNTFVGRKHIFPDGVELEIIQIKRREDEPWVTYTTKQGSSIPRKLVMKVSEFVGLYGHLFGLKDAPSKRL